MQNYDDEYVKYKKKSSATPPKKSKHKHHYEDCLFDTPSSRYDKVHGIVYDNRKLVFVMFLAVDKSLRSKGYGRAILKEIQNKYPNKKIII